MPARELADGALVLVGGTLLMTPGFLSDAAGLFCILPFTRPLARSALTRFLTRRLLAGAGLTAPFPERPSAGDGPRAQERRGPGPGVVRGEVVD
jgi:UPF0716 protein FxsA